MFLSLHSNCWALIKATQGHRNKNKLKSRLLVVSCCIKPTFIFLTVYCILRPTAQHSWNVVWMSEVTKVDFVCLSLDFVFECSPVQVKRSQTLHQISLCSLRRWPTFSQSGAQKWSSHTLGRLNYATDFANTGCTLVLHTFEHPAAAQLSGANLHVVMSQLHLNTGEHI